MKPTVGRIVHLRFRTGYTCAAIVTRVHTETVVNVVAFPDGPFGAESATRPDNWYEQVPQRSDTHEAPMVWFWPPREE